MKPCAVVLAGGIGKRFAPFVTTKTLFPFFGKPLLWHVLERVRSAGIDDVLIVTNNENHVVAGDLINSFGFKGNRILQDEPLGMGHAIYIIKEALQGPVVVMNGVDIVDMTLIPALLKETEKYECVVVGMERETYFPGGYLQFHNDRITAVIEKPAPENVPSKFVKLVFDYYKNPNQLVTALEKVGYSDDDSYEKALSLLLYTTKTGFVPYRGMWSKLKYPFHALDVVEQLLIAPHIDETAQIAPSAIIKNSYIGSRTIIGDGVLVRDSIIEADCVIGFGTEVARSYVGPRTQTHHAFIGDSVLEGDTNVSYGTCCTNMRMDGKPVAMKLDGNKILSDRKKLGAMVARGVFFSAGVLTMPGTTIPANEKIFPGTTVR